mmetsp:Transcript_93138/g.263015  ORF Transcript_93138/g.263015 Transcript_93138/m.263015 type:complete len:226 (-) Transcript_93138:39-716(-)
MTHQCHAQPTSLWRLMGSVSVTGWVASKRPVLCGAITSSSQSSRRWPTLTMPVAPSWALPSFQITCPRRRASRRRGTCMSAFVAPWLCTPAKGSLQAISGGCIASLMGTSKRTTVSHAGSRSKATIAHLQSCLQTLASPLRHPGAKLAWNAKRMSFLYLVPIGGFARLVPSQWASALQRCNVQCARLPSSRWKRLMRGERTMPPHRPTLRFPPPMTWIQRLEAQR